MNGGAYSYVHQQKAVLKYDNQSCVWHMGKCIHWIVMFMHFWKQLLFSFWFDIWHVNCPQLMNFLVTLSYNLTFTLWHLLRHICSTSTNRVEVQALKMRVPKWERENVIPYIQQAGSLFMRQESSFALILCFHSSGFGTRDQIEPTHTHSQPLSSRVFAYQLLIFAT